MILVVLIEDPNGLKPPFSGHWCQTMTDHAPALQILCKWFWTEKDVVWQHLKQATWQHHEWSRADISLIGMLLYKK